MTPEEVLADADDERNRLTAQAIRQHLSNMESEGRRFAEDIRRIEGVYQLRLSQLPESRPS